jgi:hypothetical protein
MVLVPDYFTNSQETWVLGSSLVPELRPKADPSSGRTEHLYRLFLGSFANLQELYNVPVCYQSCHIISL